MKGLFKFLLTVAMLALVFLGGYSWRDFWAHRPPSLQGLAALFDPAYAPKKQPTELFQDQFDHVVANAAVPVDPIQLKYAAMAGMFSALGDPHTSFLDPYDAGTLKLTTTGNFVGIGARLADDPAGAKVAILFKDAPAERAGVKAGDTIIEVDGKTTAGRTTDEIVKMIRGEEGTIVRIKVVRADESDPLTMAIRREVVVIPSAEGKMLPGRIAYVSVTEFAQTTTKLFDAALESLIAQRPEGLIVDLRKNPGGLLETAVQMLGRFVEDKPAVRTKRRGGPYETIYTPMSKVKGFTGPVVVLVDEDSASAAEIFAGVLQEYRKAVLVGNHTYGKSSVQNVRNLIDLSSAKITVAKYYLPSGRDIGRKLDEDGEYLSGGLKPDIEVLPDYEEETVFGLPDKDVQLRKAMEHIRSKGAQKSQASGPEPGLPYGYG